MTDPSGYAKTLALPAGFDAPRLLRYEAEARPWYPSRPGGAQVIGAIFPFRELLPVNEAQTLVWRRETGRSNGRYDPLRNADHPDKVFVDAHEGLHNEFDVMLVVRFRPTSSRSTETRSRQAPSKVHKPSSEVNATMGSAT